MAKLTLLDLTVAQVEAIEERSGVPFDKWTDNRNVSRAALMGSMLVELEGRSADDVGAMKMGDMVTAFKALIDL